jgi:hypothetical protein
MMTRAFETWHYFERARDLGAEVPPACGSAISPLNMVNALPRCPSNTIVTIRAGEYHGLASRHRISNFLRILGHHLLQHKCNHGN